MTVLTAPPHPVPRPRALPCCPQCHTPLDGGPVVFHCGPCGHGVMAADLPSEYGSRP